MPTEESKKFIADLVSVFETHDGKLPRDEMVQIAAATVGSLTLAASKPESLPHNLEIVLRALIQGAGGDRCEVELIPQEQLPVN